MAATDGVPDMIIISDINENGINTNLHIRYKSDQIYTYTGSILVAVNPYKTLPIYEESYIRHYREKTLSQVQPHIYAIAEGAYRSLIDDGRNQSCIISGESGAGKTESTKFILQYLCSVTSHTSIWVEQQILEANTILEAFGNAKTVRNDNSSRFGKFIQVCFDDSHNIKGCVIQDYLLEQSRLTFQSINERNYHIFYQFVASAQQDSKLAKSYHISDMQSYNYLNQSGCYTLDSVDDAKLFDSLRLALGILNISVEMMEGLFTVLSSILLLGNLVFGAHDDGETSYLTGSDKDIITIICDMLGMDYEGFVQMCLYRQIQVRGMITDIPYKVHEASENRHAMAKALYSRTFAWLVDSINKCANPGTGHLKFLGVLDIFGFENFKVNSFEQLCINYTNEKLHRFFNHYVFTLEQEIYRKEEISFCHITFTDNTACLELIEKSPSCILKVLDEECRFPQGSDQSFLTKIHNEFDAHPHYIKGTDRRLWDQEFAISHYAGIITYHADDFLTKNRDTQQDQLFELMHESSKAFVKDLTRFQDLLGVRLSDLGGRQTISRTARSKPTVADTFKHQLSALVDVLAVTNPWYIRCLKPNSRKVADHYEMDEVLCQLQYSGMLDIIRIKREGYPVHLHLTEFRDRYLCILSRDERAVDKDDDDALRGMCFGVVSQICADTKLWQVGKTMVFLKTCTSTLLETKRKETLSHIAILLQRTWRGYICYKRFHDLKKAAITLQRRYRAIREHLEYMRKKHATIIIQAYLRGMFGREVARELRHQKKLEQEREEAMRLEELERERLALERARIEEEERERRMAQELIVSHDYDVEPEQLLTVVKDDNDDELPFVMHYDLQQSMSELEQLTVTIEKLWEDHNLNISPQSLDLDELFSFLLTPDTPFSDQKVGNKEKELMSINEQFETIEELLILETEANGNKMASESLTTSAEAANDLGNSDVEEHLPPPPPELFVIDTETEDFPLPPPPFEIDDAQLNAPSDDDSDLGSPPPKPPLPASYSRENLLTICKVPSSSVEMSNKAQQSSSSMTEHPTGVRTTRDHIPVIMSSESDNHLFIRKVSVKSQSDQDSSHVVIRTHSLKENHSPETPSNALPASRSCTNINNKLVRNGQPSSNHLYPPVSLHNPAVIENFPKERVIKRLKEIENHKRHSSIYLTDLDDYNMEDYAMEYFNDHIRDIGGSVMKTLKKKSNNVMSKNEMLVYCKSGVIPTSHLKLHDIENINLACSIFKELTKYMKEDLKPDNIINTIQYIIKCGIERVELRDEIFVQLIRQTTGNTHTNGLVKAWALFCHCSAAFSPNKFFAKYVLSYIRKHRDDPHVGRYCQTCIKQLRRPKLMPRKYPPSALEIASIDSDSPLLCRVYFMDGKTKTVSIQPCDTSSEVLEHVAQKIGLRSVEGWALYEVTSHYERFIRGYEYLADILSVWEQQKHNFIPTKKNDSSSKKGIGFTTIGHDDARFVFRKRVYKDITNVLHDPLEYRLLFSEAVYKVVKCDEFQVSTNVALQLAGLQLQACVGDYDDTKHNRYTDVEPYLCKRILSNTSVDWQRELASAHKHYGTGKTEIEAMVWYLTCVKQFPLYGCTLFPIIHKGVWSHKGGTILAVSLDGIKFIKAKDKSVIHEFQYSDIANFNVDPNENYITFELKSEVTLSCLQRSFIFETAQKEDIGFLVASYSATHTTWLKTDKDTMSKERLTEEDKLRVYEEILNCRKSLIGSSMLRKPLPEGGPGFLRNTIRRLTKSKMERLRRGSVSQHDGVFNQEYWSFRKTPIRQALTMFLDPSFEELAVKMFTSCLDSYSMQDLVVLARNHVELSQIICHKCMECDALCNEFYLQLIKQTTDHPDTNSELNQWYWQMMAILICTVLPCHSLILSYLQVHLKKCSIDSITVEGKYSRYCQKCLMRNVNKKRRKFAPSSHEIQYIMQRQQIKEKVYFLSGECRVVEYDSATTAYEMMQTLKTKIGMRSDAAGFGLYEVIGNKDEKYMALDERVSDAICKWERRNKGTNVTRKQKLLFKKRLFIMPYLDHSDPTECELVFHQLTDDVFEKNIPITQQDAVQLCALKLQVELDVSRMAEVDYSCVMRILPRDLRENIDISLVKAAHTKVNELSCLEAILAFIEHLKSWLYFGATVFDVKQNYTNSMPALLKLLVSEMGVHILDMELAKVYGSHRHDDVSCSCPSLQSLMLIIGPIGRATKYVFSTPQASEIVSLIRDYGTMLKSMQPYEEIEQYTTSAALEASIDV